MKKNMSRLLAALLILASLAGCGQKEPETANTAAANAETVSTAAEPVEEQFAEWTREGYYTDGDDNLLFVTLSDDEDMPGWYVGCMLGDDTYGWFVEQVRDTLHGDLAGGEEDAEPFVVTISEEGEDGLLLEVEGGETYHLTYLDLGDAAIAVYINTDGDGLIDYMEGEGELTFEDAEPWSSAYVGLKEPAVYTIGARPEEGWKFVKWLKDDEEFSREPCLTLELTESADYTAVFMKAGRDETHVDLDQVTELGQVLGLPEYETAMYGDYYVYAFEQDEVFYRAIAEVTPEVFDAVFELDWEDEDYEEKKLELLAPLKVLRIENFSEMEPTQEELDALIGKTGAELFEDGWVCWGWDLDGMVFYMDHGVFSYLLGMEGEVEDYENFESEDAADLVVVSAEFNGLGDMTALDLE